MWWLKPLLFIACLNSAILPAQANIVGGNEIKNITMIGAKSTLTLPLPPGYSGSVRWQAISDFGGISPVATAIIVNKSTFK